MKRQKLNGQSMTVRDVWMIAKAVPGRVGLVCYVAGLWISDYRALRRRERIRARAEHGDTVEMDATRARIRDAIRRVRS